MPTQPNILLIEGRGNSAVSFKSDLKNKGYNVTVANTGREAREMLASTRPDIIVMDTTSSATNGVRICKTIRAITAGTPFIYISPKDRPIPPSLSVDITLSRPFTIRKLSNRIERLLPSVDGPVFQVGPLTLHVDRRTLVKNQRERRLTPKLAHLIEMFMRHPGETLSRRQLMKTVWETEYMDDTRTLDVHVRWVREAIEDNPSRPRFLTTVRGKGYCFSIPEQNNH
jgi:DNA-binding response OmpR family regulator